MKLIKTLNYNTLPEHMRGSAEAYIMAGGRPGSFLSFIFENDFVHAASHADSINIKYLATYAEFLWNAPAGCWGSKEKVEGWIKSGGLKGMLEAKDA